MARKINHGAAIGSFGCCKRRRVDVVVADFTSLVHLPQDGPELALAVQAVDGLLSSTPDFGQHISSVGGQALVFLLHYQFECQLACVGMFGGDKPLTLFVDFNVPPPLLDRINGASSQSVIQLRKSLCRRGCIDRHPAERAISKETFQIPWTGFHTPAAHCA